jgi:hypothetical protein
LEEGGSLKRSLGMVFPCYPQSLRL